MVKISACALSDLPTTGVGMRTWRLLAGLVGLILVAGVGCSVPERGKPDPVPQARVDHSTMTTTATPLADAGPAAGSLGESWHVDTALGQRPDQGDSWVSRRLVNGQLILASARGLDVHDAGTGRERWHYREPGRTLDQYAETAGSLVAVTTSGRGETIRWVGLDLATGRVLWTSAGKGLNLSEGRHEALAGAGIVPAIKMDDGAVRAVDARTGGLRWTRADLADRGCEIEIGDQKLQDSDGSLFALTEKCGRDHRLVAVEPATGRRRWVRAVDQAASVSVRSGVTLIDDGAFVLVGADGRELEDPHTAYHCGTACHFEVVRDHAVVAYSSAGDRAGWLILDLRRGRSVVRSAPQFYEDVVAAGGRLYGLHREVAPVRSGFPRLLPAGLDVVDPVAGTVQTRPLPFAGTYLGDVVGESRVDWIAVAGERVFAGRVVDGTARTTAYAMVKAGGPAELGGVPASDWPDACTVAPGHRALRDMRTDADDAVIGSTRLPGVSCLFSGEDGSGATDVTIAWVAATPRLAHGLLADSAKADSQPVSGADEAYSIDSGNPGLWLRAGRYILRVTDTGVGPPRLASVVAKHLHGR